MVKILITGAGGGLGRTLIDHLCRPETSLEPAWPGPIEMVALSRKHLDVSARNDVAEIVARHHPKILIHAAGFTDIEQCEFDRWQAYLVNRDAPEHVAVASARHGALVVYPGTDRVFDGTKLTPYTEEDPPNPISVYGETKLGGELAIMSHARRWLILRTGWMYGRFGSNFLTRLIDSLHRSDVATAANDPISQPTCMDDFVRAILHCLRHGIEGLYHAAAQGSCTPFQFSKRVADLISSATKVKPPEEGVQTCVALHPKYSVLDCSRIDAMGYHPPAWEASLETFLRENQLVV